MTNKSRDKKSQITQVTIPGDIVVEIDPRYFRPTEVDILMGDPSKAKGKLGWQPRVGFMELVKMMVESDIEEAKKDLFCKTEGFKAFNYHE